ncbi:MAG TPA: hypothetical protein H9668_01065 [Firmicutes bacterium]|nr:hypothetical protein [Bacillota bacterium]
MLELYQLIQLLAVKEIVRPDPKNQDGTAAGENTSPMKRSTGKREKRKRKKSRNTGLRKRNSQ